MEGFKTVYSEELADKAVKFIRCLKHTKGKWAGVNFNLLPWQEHEIIRPIFGTVKPNGKRQYRTCYVEVPKKNGKTEIAAAIALYLLFADGEIGGEVYSAAADRQQASLVFNVAAQMVRQEPALESRSKIIDSQKRIINYKTNSIYVALSNETCTKHGLNPSGVIIDELHAHPNRELYDVLVEGTDTAREQQLIFIITTAGVHDPNSIGWEVHEYARQVKEGIIEDPTFLPIKYGADEDADWEDEKVWAVANPSLGSIFDIEKIRDHYKAVKNTPSRQNNFRRYRLNQWVKSITRWINMNQWDACAGDLRFTNKDERLDYIRRLHGRLCYGGLDLSSTTDLTAFVLLFPPTDDNGIYDILPYFWIPEDNMIERSRRDKVPYDMWVRAGLITATPGNAIDYKFIKKVICEEIPRDFNCKEIAYDRWGATKLIQEIEEEGATVVPMGQGFASMSAPTKEFETLVLKNKICHGGHPVLRWNMDNTVVKQDPAGNIKPDKSKSTERIDGIVATIMALDRAIRHRNKRSVYEDRGLKVL